MKLFTQFHNLPWLVISWSVQKIFSFFMFLKTTNHCLLSLKILISLMPTVFLSLTWKQAHATPTRVGKRGHALGQRELPHRASETDQFISKDDPLGELRAEQAMTSLLVTSFSLLPTAPVLFIPVPITFRIHLKRQVRYTCFYLK